MSVKLHSLLPSTDHIRRTLLKKHLKEPSAVPHPLIQPLFASAQMSSQVASAGADDFFDLNTALDLFKFDASERQILSNTSIYSSKDLLLNRKKAYDAFQTTSQTKIGTLLTYAHNTTPSLSNLQKFESLVISVKDLANYKNFFNLKAYKECVVYSGNVPTISDLLEPHPEKHVYEILNLDMNATQPQELNNNLADKAYRFFVSLYQQYIDSNGSAPFQQPIQPYLINQTSDIQQKLFDLEIYTVGKFIVTDMSYLIEKGVSQDTITALQTSMLAPIFSQLAGDLSQKANYKLLNYYLYNQVPMPDNYAIEIAGLCTLCAKGKTKDWISTTGGVSDFATRVYNTYKTTPLVYGTILDDQGKAIGNKTITLDEFFETLADYQCIRSIAKKDEKKNVSVRSRYLDQKIKLFMESAKCKAVMQLVVMFKFRDNLMVQLRSDGILAADQTDYKEGQNVYISDTDTKAKISFLNYLQRKDVQQLLSSAYNKQATQKVSTLLTMINAVSYDLNQEATSNYVLVSLRNALSYDPLSESEIIANLFNGKGAVDFEQELKDKLKKYQEDLKKIVDEGVLSADNINYIAGLEALAKNCVENLDLLNAGSKYFLTINTMVRMAFNRTTSDLTIPKMGFAAESIMKLSASFSFVAFFFAAVFEGQWDAMKITVFSLSLLAILGQIMAITFELGYKTLLVIIGFNLLMQAAMAFLCIVYAWFSFQQGCALWEAGYKVYGFFMVTMSIFSFVAGALSIASLWWVALGPWGMVAGTIAMLIGFFLWVFGPDDKTAYLQDMKDNKFKDSSIWGDDYDDVLTEEEKEIADSYGSYPMMDVTAIKTPFPERFQCGVGPIWGKYEAAAKIKQFLKNNNIIFENYIWTGTWYSENNTSFAQFTLYSSQ